MKRHLQYHWWSYLAAILLPILVWCTVFDALDRPARDETLKVLFVGEGLDTAALHEGLSTALEEGCEQELSEITVAQTLPGAVSLNELLTARSFDYDLIIVCADYLADDTAQNVFARLPEALMFSQAPIYSESVADTELPYGYCLNSGTETNFSACYDGLGACVLFFSPESVNLDAAYGRGEVGNNAAVVAAQYLMGGAP